MEMAEMMVMIKRKPRRRKENVKRLLRKLKIDEKKSIEKWKRKEKKCDKKSETRSVCFFFFYYNVKNCLT